MPDWNKYKVQDLQSELKQRSLPVSGKKPELIARLQEYESKNSSAKSAAPAASTAPTTSAAPPPAAAPTSTLPAEDDIDWLDEDIPTTTTTAPPATSAASAPAPAQSTSATSAASSAEKATSAPAAAAIAAGGLGQVPNPTAVPNQKIDTDPSTTSDLTVKGDAAIPSEKPAAIIAASGESTKPAKPRKSAEPEGAKEPAPAPAKDFTSGLAKTELEKELAAHKWRAEKFGGNVEEASTAVVNALEREKKVGAGDAGSVLSKLDQPLAERGPRKRGRGNIPGEEGDRERGGKRRQVNQRGRGGGERPRRGERQRNGGGRDGGGAAGGAVKPAMVSEADKKKAQERKEKFEREAKKLGAGA